MKPKPELNELVIALSKAVRGGVAVFFLLYAFSSPFRLRVPHTRRWPNRRGTSRARFWTTHDASGSAVDDDYYVWVIRYTARFKMYQWLTRPAHNRYTSPGPFTLPGPFVVPTWFKYSTNRDRDEGSRNTGVSDDLDTLSPYLFAILFRRCRFFWAEGGGEKKESRHECIHKCNFNYHFILFYTSLLCFTFYFIYFLFIYLFSF